MVIVKASANSETMKVRLEVSGHAGQAEPGKDIVCSAVSILTYTLAHSIKDIVPTSSINMSHGDAIIEAECKDMRSFVKALNALRVITKGYTLLARQYPEYVKFIDEA